MILVSLLVLVGAGGFLAMKKNDHDGFVKGNNPKLPCLTFYTSGLATTPQLAFWHAVVKGRILEKCNIRVKLWKNMDDLRGILLAGKGDLWLGHTDGFFQAARRGAPVKLMVTTGWRKFYLVSVNSDKTNFKDFQGKTLAFAPPSSPAVPILQAIARKDTDKILFLSHEPRQLAMKLVRGDLDAALVPEPLVTTLLQKVKGLKVTASVEDAYGLHTRHLPRMPIAGIAVNTGTLDKYPELMAFIAKEIMQQGEVLKANPLAGVESLPFEFESFVSKKFVADSLTRDLLTVELSHTIENEILDYLAIIKPNVPTQGLKSWTNSDLFWR
jgi:NitT/TauT family transport system substrate-binding protein